MQNAPVQGEHSSILSTFIKLPFVIKIFVLSILNWQFYTCFTVFACWVFFHAFHIICWLFKINFFKRFFQEHVRMSNILDTYTLWVMIYVQTVCKGYQQTTKLLFTRKELNPPPPKKKNNNKNQRSQYMWSSYTGFKLGPDSWEKWLLPPGKLGRSDSKIGRSYSTKLRHFQSV